MNLQQCISTVEAFFNAGFGHIHFLGGEPLASPYIFDVIKYAKELGMIITINSNAILLDHNIQNILIDLKVDQFAASLDGCSSHVNDSIRGVGTFDKVITNMKAFNELKTHLHSSITTALVFTLTKLNINDLYLLPKLANEIGVDLIVLTTFIESGHGQQNRDVFNIKFTDICEVIDTMVSKELSKYATPIQIDMRPRFCEYLSSKYGAPIVYNIKNSLCCAGEDIWYLEANGDVHPCLIFQMESGKKALINKVYMKEEINVIRSRIDEIEYSAYWNTFLSAKQHFDTSKIPTCQGCRQLERCKPCFLDYYNYNRLIPECEWVKKKERQLFQDIANKEINIFNNVFFDEQESVIYKDKTPVLALDDQIAITIWALTKKLKKPLLVFKEMRTLYEANENDLRYDIATFVYTLLNNKLVQIKDRGENV
jgi:MoaA/NifB/PqqE/SkfB family radical SAM enzyme